MYYSPVPLLIIRADAPARIVSSNTPPGHEHMPTSGAGRERMEPFSKLIFRVTG